MSDNAKKITVPSWMVPYNATYEQQKAIAEEYADRRARAERHKHDFEHKQKLDGMLYNIKQLMQAINYLSGITKQLETSHLGNVASTLPTMEEHLEDLRQMNHTNRERAKDSAERTVRNEEHEIESRADMRAAVRKSLPKKSADAVCSTLDAMDAISRVRITCANDLLEAWKRVKAGEDARLAYEAERQKAMEDLPTTIAQMRARIAELEAAR